MKKLLGIILLSGIIWACESSDEQPDVELDNFDREAMLVNWADNIIVPGYQDYVGSLNDLESATVDFTAEPNLSNLEDLRGSWLDAYLAFQEISMFEIGPAEAKSFRNYSNVYPTNASEIEDYVSSGNYNLELPSTIDAQGFPALDYLLFGLAETDLGILEKLQTSEYTSYLNAVVVRLKGLGTSVLNEWTNNYRDTFVSNSGSTATSSVNKLTNDFMFYYEKALRAGKIGIPAGVFSGNPLSDRVEGLYSKQYSKELFNAALSASEDFFKGEHYHGSGVGESLLSYLNYMEDNTGEEKVGLMIADQFDKVEDAADQMGNSFFDQVETDNSKMLMTYDELQKNVILMKVDMFQMLSIRIDYVDADGD